MAGISLPVAGQESCWTRIGIWGDRTCAELPRVSDCRNCEVYASRGRGLLDRPAPEGYLDSWSALLAAEKVTAHTVTSPYLIFRLGRAWFAFLAASLQEIAAKSTIRTVPHRSREILMGLVNVRGELYPCMSLHRLFGEEAETQAGSTPRFLVARWQGENWVFPADHVDGIHDIPVSSFEPPPATLSSLAVVYTQNLFHYEDKLVAIINEPMLFGELARRFA